MAQWFLSSSVLILVIMVLRRLLRGRIGLRLQYALWALVLARLLVPFSLPASQISVQNIAADVPVEEVTRIHIPAQSFDDAYAQVVREYEDKGEEVEKLDPSTLEAQAVERMESDLTVGQALSAIWITGAAAVLIFTAWCNHRFRARLRKDRWKIDVSWISLPVYVSDSLDTPCIFGIFHPTIYLTPDIAGDETRMRHILEHEMTHYFHGDHILAPMRCLALAMHWFNPLAWWAAKTSKQDGELACDEGTIRRIGEGERMAYGRTLIQLTCEHMRPMDVILTATTMSDDKKTIKERIVMIARKPTTAIYTLIAVILTAAIAVGCTFTGAVEAPDPAEVTQNAAVTLEFPTGLQVPEAVLDKIEQWLHQELQADYSNASAVVTNVLQEAEQYSLFVYRVSYDLLVDGLPLTRDSLAVFLHLPYAAESEEQWQLLDHLSGEADARETAAEYWRQWYLSEEQTSAGESGQIPGGNQTLEDIPREHRLDDERMYALHESLWSRLRAGFDEGEAGAVITDLIPIDIGESLPNVYLYQMEYDVVLNGQQAYQITEYPIFLYTPGEESNWSLVTVLSGDDLECFRADAYIAQYGSEYAAAAAVCVPESRGNDAADIIAHTNGVLEGILEYMGQQEAISVLWTEDGRTLTVSRFTGRLSRGFDWMPAEAVSGQQEDKTHLTLAAGDQQLVFWEGSNVVECSVGAESRFYRAIQREQESVYDAALRVYDMARFLTHVPFEADTAQEAVERFLNTVLPSRHLDTRQGSWYQAEEVKILEYTLDEQTDNAVISGTVRYAFRQEALSLDGYGNLQIGEGEYEGWLIMYTGFELENTGDSTWVWDAMT